MVWDAWVIVGFIAQFLFAMRFVVQWVASERRKSSYVPEAFWYFSVLGGAMLLVYAIKRRDPVFILGQSAGLFIYARNIYFVRASRSRTPGEPERAAGEGPASIPGQRREGT